MENAIGAMEQAASLYLKDLDAMSEAQLLESAGGSARVAVDFTYEVALINRRIASRLLDIEPPALPDDDGWMVAPSELRSKSEICGFLRSACVELTEAAKSLPECESGKMIGAPGSERPAFGMVQFAAMHTMYHDAQLNFIQSLQGDLEMHWR